MSIMVKSAFTQNIINRGNLPDFRIKPLRKWRNGVVVRMPNHLGDAVMALPALMELKKIIPENCGLFVIAPAYMTGLFESIPIVDTIVPLNSIHAMWSKEERYEVKQLRAGAIILFNNSPRDAFSARLAGIPELYGAACRGRSMLLTRALRFPRREPGNPKHSHQTMRYLAITSSLGAPEWKGELPEITPKEPLNELAPEIKDICRHPQLLLLCAGAAYGAAKRWPEKSFNAVARYWLRHGGIVAVLGSKGEYEIGVNVCAGLPENKVFNLCGKTGMRELIHLFKSSVYTVANDSGLMHLGAILDTHGIVPFGPTDFSDTGPITQKWKILSDQVPCSPCLRHTCPKGEKICMTPLTAARIIREIRKSVRELNIPFSKSAKH